MLHLVSIDLLSLSLILGLILAQEIHHFKFTQFFHEILRKDVFSQDSIKFAAQTGFFIPRIELRNIVVKNGDELNEVELANQETPKEQPLKSMPLLETNYSWRSEQTAGMDMQGNTYENAIEYSFVSDPFGEEEYSACDAWYLGANYSKLTGTWYFPADQIQDGFAHIRLIGDGNVIYDNSELNAGNCRSDFDIDVSGVRKLSFEYNGICDITDILFGMSDAKLYS